MNSRSRTHKFLSYLTIWVRPKNTLRAIIEEDPNFGVIMLGILLGITASLRASVIHGLHPLPDLMGFHPFLDDIIRIGVGRRPGFLMTSASIIVYGSVVGVVLILIGGFLLRVGGMIGGGRGNYNEARAAIAWSFVPYTMMLPVWIIYSILNFSDLRALPASGLHAMEPMGWFLLSLVLLDSALRIVSLIYLIITVTDIHRIAPAKSVAIVVVAIVPLTLVMIPWQGLPF